VWIVLDRHHPQRREPVQVVRCLGLHSALNSSNGSPQAVHV
jgi:hypothetical protein